MRQGLWVKGTCVLGVRLGAAAVGLREPELQEELQVGWAYGLRVWV